jgi:hypothetical protein
MARMAGDAETLIEFAAVHFSEGAVLAGDVDEPPAWDSISVVAARLRQHCRAGRDNPYAYCDVMVRK